MTTPTPHPPHIPHDPEHRWYLPSWGERIRLMGWRVIYFIPALLAGALLLVAPFAVLLSWKLLIVVVALPLGAAMNAARHALRHKKEPFCIHCGYGLTGLPDGHLCPECGVQFYLIDIDDYRRDPHWFIRRQKMQSQLPAASPVFHAGPVRSPRSKDGT